MVKRIVISSLHQSGSDTPPFCKRTASAARPGTELFCVTVSICNHAHYSLCCQAFSGIYFHCGKNFFRPHFQRTGNAPASHGRRCMIYWSQRRAGVCGRFQKSKGASHAAFHTRPRPPPHLRVRPVLPLGTAGAGYIPHPGFRAHAHCTADRRRFRFFLRRRGIRRPVAQLF